MAKRRVVDAQLPSVRRSSRGPATCRPVGRAHTAGRSADPGIVSATCSSYRAGQSSPQLPTACRYSSGNTYRSMEGIAGGDAAHLVRELGERRQRVDTGWGRPGRPRCRWVCSLRHLWWNGLRWVGPGQRRRSGRHASTKWQAARHARTRRHGGRRAPPHTGRDRPAAARSQQRGWNEQPVGGEVRLGGSPRTRLTCSAPSTEGREASSARV